MYYREIESSAKAKAEHNAAHRAIAKGRMALVAEKKKLKKFDKK